MLQPFEPMKLGYIQKLVKLKKHFLVSQTYNRYAGCFSDEDKIGVLFSEYDAEGQAQIHLNAVRHDKYASIIDLRKPKHYKRIVEMMQPRSEYFAFWAVVSNTADLEKRINLTYKDNMKAYITKHTTWRIGGEETIRPAIAVIFGELFITLKYAGQTLKVAFSDIEKV
ncbi:MAG: hypothetical protein ABI813_07005 [Bacteroidota bacterium]